MDKTKDTIEFIELSPPHCEMCGKNMRFDEHFIWDTVEEIQCSCTFCGHKKTLSYDEYIDSKIEFGRKIKLFVGKEDAMD